MWIKAAALAGGVAAIVAGARNYAERTRVIDGTWLYMYEGSKFVEQRLAGRQCELSRTDQGWLRYDIRQVYRSYGDEQRPYASSGSYRTQYGKWRMEAFEIRFEGRRRYTPQGSGHMGMSKFQYDVDRMLSVRPISNLTCNVR